MKDFRTRRKGGVSLPFVAVAVAALMSIGGCLDGTYIPEDRTDRTPRSLQLTSQAGGVHHRGLMHEGTWYVSQGPTLLAIDPRTGKVRGEELIAPEGSSGAIVDMAIWGSDLLVVLDETAVARVDLQSARNPVTLEVIDAAKLGIDPKELSVVGDALYVSGRGGVVRLPDMKRFLIGKDVVGRVAPSEHGPVAVMDRRVVSLADGGYIGAATFVEPLPSSIGIEGGLVFALQRREGATVGLMGPDVRERESGAVAGYIRRVRVISGRLWVVTDTELVSWDISQGVLTSPEVFKLKGGRDIDAISDNYMAVVGSFGRAVLRLRDDSTGLGDEFLRITRVPGRLDLAISDQRTCIGSSLEGTWSYPVRGTPKLVDRQIEVWGIPARTATAFWGTAKIAGDDESSTRVEISGGTGGSRGEWTAPHDSRIWVLSVVDGDLWVGHDRGVSVLRSRDLLATGGGAYPVVQSEARGSVTAECPLVEIGSIVWEGPIFNLAPLRTGQGASFVSRWGGFGVAEWLAPSSSKPQPAAASRVSARTDTPRRTIDDR